MSSKNQNGAPGQWLKRSASRNRAVRLILAHTHVLQIVDDHQLLWFEADDEMEREKIRARLQKQLVLAGVNLFGFEVASHGVVAFFSNPYLGGALFVFGAALVYLTDRWH